MTHGLKESVIVITVAFVTKANIMMRFLSFDKKSAYTRFRAHTSRGIVLMKENTCYTNFNPGI